ncbi:MAG: LptA/OstA family protein, partial [Pseudomonadota bacterium]
MNRPLHANLMLKKRVTTRLLVTTAVAGLFAFVPMIEGNLPAANVSKANAQSTTASQIFGDAAPQEDDQLLLESDDLIFDNDRQLVIATGNVQIAFGQFALVADKVEYNQQSGRLIAIGNVEILEPNGNRIFAQEIDITDDFRDGFVSALNVQTPDNTRIAAESAERVDGEITAFNNGVYTACKACKENPQKPPFWQIRAKKVTIDNDTRNVEYEDATLEFFGKPLVRLSRFAHADPAIKRKSGFLIPTFTEDDILGIGTGL